MWSFLSRKVSVKTCVQLWPVAVPALMCSGAFVYNYRHNYTTHHQQLSFCAPPAAERKLPKDEFSKKIDDKGASIREKYKHTAECRLMIWSIAGSPGTQSVELKLPVNGGDVAGVLAVWMGVLSLEGGVELHSLAEDSQGGKVLSFVAVPHDDHATAASTTRGNITTRLLYCMTCMI
jgi:hypothetical protein